MTSVQPSLDDDLKSQKDDLRRAQALQNACYCPLAVRLVLNGRHYDITEDASRKIPLLTDILYGHEQTKTTSVYHDDSAEDGDLHIRRNSFMQCTSVLDLKSTPDPVSKTDFLTKDSQKSSQYNRAYKPNTETSLDEEAKKKESYAPRVPELGVKRGKTEENKPETTLYFQRNATVFEAVLDFVQSGELHVPGDVCPKLFARDLEFWGFEVSDLDPCCYPKVVSFLEEQKTVMRFHESCASPVHPPLDLSSKSVGRTRAFWRRFRHSSWLFMTDPWSSVQAKVYFVLLCLVILTSFFVMAAGTTKQFTRGLTRGEWKEFLGDEYDNYAPSIPYFYEDDESFLDSDMTSTTPRTTTTTESQSTTTIKYTPRALVNWLQYLSYATTAFLTVDYLLKILFCPSLRQFILNIINIADCIALIATYAKHIINLTNPQEMYEDTTTDIINILQLFRVLRFLGPMSKLRGFRVIYFTLKNSIMELMLMSALLACLVMFFSALLFYLGDKTSLTSIPVAAWYALVTMTTVGYGDVVPHSFSSKIIGSICAIMGVLFIAMTLPIVVNNFFSLYTSCSIVPPSLKKKKKKARKLGTSLTDIIHSDTKL